MQENVECLDCQGTINIKFVSAKKSKMKIGDEEYICIYYLCPHCTSPQIFSIDNIMTAKIHNTLMVEDKKMQNLRNTNKITKNVISKNIKLRMKLNLLRQTLYKNIQHQSYQLFDENNNIIKTGIFELPNL